MTDVTDRGTKRRGTDRVGRSQEPHVEAVDLNFGCPTEDARKGGGGLYGRPDTMACRNEHRMREAWENLSTLTDLGATGK